MSRIDLLLELLDCRVEQDWSEKIFTLARSHGFHQALIAVIPNKKTPLESAFLCSNFPSSWIDTYNAEKLHYVDPIVKHCLGSGIPLIWSPEVFATPKQKQLYEDACGYGIRSGVVLPMHGANGEFGVISFVLDAHFSQKTQRLIHHLLPELALIRDYAFESSSYFAYPLSEKDRKIKLTKRELECLKWTKEGKTSWETSVILKCSESVVNFHINNLRRKFSVTSRQQVVVKALRLGIITLS